MATQVLKNVKFYVDGYDLSGDHNQHSLSLSRDAVENTTFGNDSRTYLPGLGNSSHTHQGFYEALATSDGPDDALWGNYSLIVTLGPQTGASGEVAYSHASIRTDNAVLDGSVGEMATFSFSGQGSGLSVRSTILEDALTANSSSGNGTAYQVGAISASETGYATLHVVAWNATTLDVTIESDNAGGFGTPTTQGTFTQATGITSEQLTVAGAVTDDWWRAEWTLVGTSATFIVTFGIA